MKKLYFAGAFSINMVKNFPVNIKISKMEGSTVHLVMKRIKDGSIESFMGHQATADILGLPFNRGNLKVEQGDTIYLAQYIGERLEEGTKVLPKGAKIEWFVINIG